MLSVGFSLLAAPVFAQPDTNKIKEDVEVQIDGNKITIEAEDFEGLSTVDLNTIIREVTRQASKIQRQQQELLAKVDKQLANGEITEEEAEEMRDKINERTEENMEMIGELMEAWGESYEDRMEAWGEEYAARMEAWEAEMEARTKKDGSAATMPPLPPVPPMPPAAEGRKKGQKIIINEDGIVIKKGDDGEEPFAWKFGEDDEDDEDEESDMDDDVDYTEKKKSIDRTVGYGTINLGFNQQLAGGTDFISNGPEELDFWRSREFNLGFGGKTRIGSPYSKLYVLYGAEFSWHGFRLNNNNLLMQNSDSAFIRTDMDTLSNRSIDRSSYHIAYFSVPVMLQLDFSKLGKTDESFTLGVGGYAGVRLGAKRKLEFNSPAFDDGEEKIKDDFFTEQFRYGVMAQVGWDSFKITAKYDLNNFFKEGAGPDYQMASVTLGFTF